MTWPANPSWPLIFADGEYRYGNLSEAFFNSAIELYEMTIKNKDQAKIDIYIFPVVFMIMHATELSIKASLKAINEDIIITHDIVKLQNILDEKIKKLNTINSEKYGEFIEQYIGKPGQSRILIFNSFVHKYPELIESMELRYPEKFSKKANSFNESSIIKERKDYDPVSLLAELKEFYYSMHETYNFLTIVNDRWSEYLSDRDNSY